MSSNWEDMIQIDDYREPYIQRWREATCLAEMASLTAAFIEGESPYFPTSTVDHVDPETALIRDDLVRLNQTGCMTVISQPGMDDGVRRQRAFVAGYAGRELAMRIARMELYSDLMVVVVPAREAVASKTMVITDENQPRGWMGIPSGHQFPAYAAVISVEALESLESSYAVLVVDLEWGRERHMWRLITEALNHDELPFPRMSMRPHADMGMDTDFFC